MFLPILDMHSFVLLIKRLFIIDIYYLLIIIIIGHNFIYYI